MVKLVEAFMPWANLDKRQKTNQGDWKRWLNERDQREQDRSNERQRKIPQPYPGGGSNPKKNMKYRKGKRTKNSAPTRTKRGSEEELGKGIPFMGTNVTSCIVKYKRGKKDKIYKAFTQPSTYQSVFDGTSVITTTGKQEYAAVGSCYHGGAGVAPSTLGTNVNTASLAKYTLYDYNPVGSGTIGTVPQVGSSSRKMAIDSFKQTTTYVNEYMTEVFVTIYNVMAKNTMKNEALVAPTMDPLESWVSGYSDAKDPDGTNKVYTDIGSKPTDSKPFNIQWKVLSKKTVTIAPGSKHIHVFKFNPNRLIDTEYFYQFDYVKGLSMREFIVYSSAPVYDTVAVKLTTGCPRVSWICQQKYTSRGMYAFPRIESSYSGINQRVPAAGNLIIVNEESDVAGTAVANLY